MAESGNAITVEELQIRITAEYGDAIRQMLKMVEEVKKVLAAKLEPIADDLAKKIDSIKPATDALSKTMSTAVKKMDGMSKTAAKTSEQLEKLQKASEGFRDIHFEVPENDDFVKDLSRISAVVKRTREDMVGLNRAYAEHIQLRARLNGLRNAAAKQKTAKKSTDDIEKVVNQAYDRIAAKTQSAGKTVAVSVEKMKTVLKAMPDAKSYADVFNTMKGQGASDALAAEMAQLWEKQQAAEKKTSAVKSDPYGLKIVSDHAKKAGVSLEEYSKKLKAAQHIGRKNTLSSTDPPKLSMRDIVNKERLTAQGMENLRKENERVKKSFESMWKVVKNTFSGIAKVVKTSVSAFASLLKYTGKFVKLGLSSVLSKMRNSFSGLNKNLRSFAGNIRNALTFSLIYKAINAVSEALRTGINNLYQYSKTINGTFAASMDRLSASMQYFKNSVGAAVSPIITALTPAIDTAVDHIVELINSLNQLIAKLSGASSWTKAVKVQKEYAEATENAAEAQKGMLAGFDELNVVQQQNGGGSSGTTDYGSMFEEVPLDEYTLPDFVQQIKERIENGDWSGVGRTLGEKVNAVVEGINWAAVGEKLGNGLQNVIDTYNEFMRTVDWDCIGSGLGESLNNLMANVDFESAGAAFAQQWNALVGVIHGFVTATDWKAVGHSIAGFINGWFDEVDWALLGQTVSTGIVSLLTTLRTAVQETDWKSIGGSISEMLNQIEWATLFSESAGLISDTVKGLLDLMIGAVEEIDWDKLGSTLWDGIISSVANIDFAGIADRFFTLWGEALAADRKFTISFWKTLAEKLTEGFSNLFTYFGNRIEECGGDIAEGILKGINNVWNSIGMWIYDHIFKPFIDGFKKIWGIASPAKEMVPMGEYIILGLLEGFKTSWNNITTWISDSFGWIKTKITGVFDDTKTSVVNIWNGMWTGIKGVINTILGGVERFANGIVKGINKVIDVLNNFNLDIPEFNLFGQTFGGSVGFDISKVSEISIPRLATGAVITSPTLGLMGEYPNAASNPEIVTPQKLLYETVTSANAEQNALLREQNNLLRQLLRKEATVNIGASAALGKVNRRSEELYAALVGG